MDGEKRRLLIMDDEPKICALLEKACAPLGFEVHTLSDSLRFEQTIKTFAPHLLIIDLKMQGVDGIQLLQRMRGIGSRATVIVISGMDQRVLNTAAKLGRAHGLNMLGVLQKPVKLDELIRLARQVPAVAPSVSRDELVSALTQREFVVHYQPKVGRTEDRWEIEGAEALVRWLRPTEGLVTPDRFLPAFEATDLMSELTDYVLRAALEQLAAWRANGLALRVAVNLSARQLDDLDFPDRLKRLLDEHRLTWRAARADKVSAVTGTRLVREVDAPRIPTSIEPSASVVEPAPRSPTSCRSCSYRARRP